MYCLSDELLGNIKKISQEIYEKTKGVVSYEEYIVLPYYGGNIILRFDLKKEKVTLDELDRYEALMYEIVKDDFLIDFMGDVYKKVGLDISHLDEYLIKCAHSYHEEKILSSPFCEKVKKRCGIFIKMC